MEYYTYDQAGKRVKKSLGTSLEFYFYGIGGQKLMSQGCVTGGGGLVCTAPHSTVYFGGKDLKITDRLGSVRWADGHAVSYFPHGEEKSSPVTADGQVKFGTYTRDNAAQDYADQRYYAVGMGRFNTADPMGGLSAQAELSQTWNRYAYVHGDPVNYSDPSGTLEADPNGGNGNGPSGPCGPNWMMDASLVGPCPGGGGGGGVGGGGGGSCGGVVALGFVPVPNPACYVPVPPPPPEPTSKPECFAQLKDRPVNDPTASKFKAVHIFWWVQGDIDGQSVQEIISAGRASSPSGIVYLNAYATPGSDNLNGDNSSQHLDWSSGLSSSLCDQVDAMINAANAFRNNTIQYHPAGALGFGGPNSNSAAHYFGVAGGFNPTPPLLAYGWNSEIRFP